MLTPLDIQNKEFKKSFRGYNLNSVDGFLDKVIEDYEKIYNENIELKYKVNLYSDQIRHYNTLEETIKNTLIVAQNSADEVINTARIKSQNIIEEAKINSRKSIEISKQKVVELNQEYDNLLKEMSSFKRIIWPVEGAIKLILRDEEKIDENNMRYFKEINDNLIQLMDFINMDREIILAIFDLHLSNNDNKMNKTMQTLTVVATIFTPMTFLTGVYGMNFKYMPELNFKWSYAIFWVIALLNITTLYRYYKKKGWI